MSTPRVSPSSGLGSSGVAGYDTRAEAERTIRYLVSQGVPAGQLSLVGTGLRMVSPPAAASPWRKVLLAGLGAGLVCGLGLAVVLWWFLPAFPVYEVVAWCVIGGAVYGIVASLVVYALSHNDSEQPVELQPFATRFEVMGDAAVAARARTLLAEAEQAEEGWEAIEVAEPTVAVDPRVWSRSAGAAEPEEEPAAKPEPAKPQLAKPEDVRPAPGITLRPSLDRPGPTRPVLPPLTVPPFTRPLVPGHATRALPGDDDNIPEDVPTVETTAARRYLDL